jgi:2-keto-3-deoxy-L-rhamnonate aldolase RhmA
MGVMAFDFFTPGLAPTLAQAGAEFVLLDMEHSGAGIDTIKTQCALRAARGIVPMVRVPACLHHLIAPVLDAGRWASWRRSSRRASRRRSSSTHAAIDRSDGAALRSAWRTTATVRAALAPRWTRANDAVITIALIESARGIDNAKSILATPGLDLAWLGHYDLSDSLECVEAFDDPRYVAAEKRLLAASNAAGVPSGWLVGTGEAARAPSRAGIAASASATS